MIRPSIIGFRPLSYTLALAMTASFLASWWGGELHGEPDPGALAHVLVWGGAILGAGCIVALLVGGTIASRRLASIRDVLARIADGDLGARARPGCVVVELDQIARSVNGLGESNSALVTELRDGSIALEREIDSFNKAFERIRGQAARSREATSTVAAAMEELGAGVGTIGRETESVEGGAQEACAISRDLNESSAAVLQTIERQFRSLREAESRMDEARASTGDLEQRTSEISGAAHSITDVAKSLRLLALNASIEAVKAGESGRGFSIVAQEVKSLADQVGGMADRIQAQVSAVYQGTRKVASDMVASAQAVGAMKADGERSVEASETQASLSREAVGKLEETSRSIGEISRTLEESGIALDEISRTSVELDSRAGATVAALAGLETGLSDLDRLSRSFRITVKDFRLQVPFFPWSDDLSVGVPRMDDQHRVLLRLINRVADLSSSGASGAAIRVILGQLVEYTRFHFADEENLMRAHEFPGVPGHHEIHETFVAEVVGMVRRLDQGDNMDAQALLGLLKDWLVRHIQGTDKVYGAHIAQRLAVE